MLVNWLDPIRSALELKSESVTLFFRNDDVGWDNERLELMLESFHRYEIPIDLAIIPKSIDEALADKLLKRQQLNPSLLGLHQHGYAHLNHEVTGRKCEFGSSRNQKLQFNDLRHGKQKLNELLGTASDNIFTPPWNRCINVTADCLTQLGFNALSRDRTAKSLGQSKLQEIPVHVDWNGISSRNHNAWRILGETIAEEINKTERGPMGIMLHHAVMSIEDLNHIDELLSFIKKQPKIHLSLMRELLH